MQLAPRGHVRGHWRRRGCRHTEKSKAAHLSLLRNIYKAWIPWSNTDESICGGGAGCRVGCEGKGHMRWGSSTKIAHEQHQNTLSQSHLSRCLTQKCANVLESESLVLDTGKVWPVWWGYQQGGDGDEGAGGTWAGPHPRGETPSTFPCWTSTGNCCRSWCCLFSLKYLISLVLMELWIY